MLSRLTSLADAARPSGVDLIDSELERLLIGEIIRVPVGEPVEDRAQINPSSRAVARSNCASLERALKANGIDSRRVSS